MGSTLRGFASNLRHFLWLSTILPVSENSGVLGFTNIRVETDTNRFHAPDLAFLAFAYAASEAMIIGAALIWSLTW